MENEQEITTEPEPTQQEQPESESESISESDSQLETEQETATESEPTQQEQLETESVSESQSETEQELSTEQLSDTEQETETEQQTSVQDDTISDMNDSSIGNARIDALEKMCSAINEQLQADDIQQQEYYNTMLGYADSINHTCTNVIALCLAILLCVGITAGCMLAHSIWEKFK